MTSGTATRVFDFIYDENGRPFACKYTINGTTTATMYYVLNLQGDVVRILNANGSTMVKYTYNAWGEVISVTNANDVAITSATHIGNLNPLRYRGYYYDVETGFYYLQSRYYDPVMHRFINADSLASTGQGVTGTNMFAYCLNNPANHIDPSGHAAWMTLMYVRVDTSRGREIHETEEAAAFQAGTLLRKETNCDDNEYICGIYELSNGGYVVGNLYKGEHASVTTDCVLGEANSYTDRKLVAMAHSHPFCTGHVPNDFSKVDMNGALYGDLSVSVYNEMPVYLAAPNGDLKVICAYDITFSGNFVTFSYYEYTVCGGLPVDNTIIDCWGG